MGERERICQLCEDREIEDEFHFILKCKQYEEIRRKYIKKYFRVRPNMFKFVELLKTSNKTNLINLSRYIKDANDKRNETLLNIS